MKQLKRFKQAMHDIRLRNCAVALGESFAKLEHGQMQKSGRTRKIIESLVGMGLATSEQNKTPEQRQLDKDYADSVERRKKIREELFDVDKDMPDGSSPENRIALIFSAAVQVYGDILIMDKMMKSGMDMDQAAAWYHRINNWNDEVANVIQSTMEQFPLWTNRFPSELYKSEPLWVKLVPDDTKEIHIPYASELTVRYHRPNPTKHFGVTPRAEGQAEREVPNRSTGESEANRDGYMTGDDEFRRIDPVKFAEE